MRAQTLLEARWILLIFALAAMATWFISAWLSLIFLSLFLFTVAFFRDPDRPVPADPNLIVAPADGRVSDIVELDEKEVLRKKTRRVGIFLSIFDVHTNRAPIDGRVIYRQMRSRVEGLPPFPSTLVPRQQKRPLCWSGPFCLDGVISPW